MSSSAVINVLYGELNYLGGIIVYIIWFLKGMVQCAHMSWVVSVCEIIFLYSYVGGWWDFSLTSVHFLKIFYSYI